MRIRNGPAAVRGDAPAPTCHWPHGREGGVGRAPRVRRPPPAAQTRTPRGRRIRVSPTLSPRRTGGSRRAARRSSGRCARAAPDRLAVTDRDRVAVRDRRRQAGRRCRRSVGLSEACSALQAVRLHAQRRGDRRLPPRPRRHLRRPGRRRRGAAEARNPCAAPAGSDESGRCVRADPAAGDRHRARTRRSVARREDEAEHRPGRGLRTEAAAQRLPRADARLLLGHVQHVHRPDLQAVRAAQHRGCRRLERLRLSAALGGVHPVLRSEPDRPRSRFSLWPCSSARSSGLSTWER